MKLLILVLLVFTSLPANASELKGLITKEGTSVYESGNSGGPPLEDKIDKPLLKGGADIRIDQYLIEVWNGDYPEIIKGPKDGALKKHDEILGIIYNGKQLRFVPIADGAQYDFDAVMSFPSEHITLIIRRPKTKEILLIDRSPL